MANMNTYRIHKKEMDHKKENQDKVTLIQKNHKKTDNRKLAEKRINDEGGGLQKQDQTCTI